jgi:hypothetical protein
VMRRPVEEGIARLNQVESRRSEADTQTGNVRDPVRHMQCKLHKLQILLDWK